jgi:hypothetical protein
MFEAKSEVNIFCEWLSPDQAEQYDLYQRFDVVGSDTGARYRIRRNQHPNRRIEHSIVLLRPLLHHLVSDA